MANPSSWSYLPHLFLAIAAVNVHFAPRMMVLLPLAVASVAGLVSGGMTGTGLGLLFSLGLLLQLATESAHQSVRWTAGPLAFLLAVALSDYALPGFHNSIVFDQVRFTPGAAPFTMYFNFDKTTSGILVALLVLGKRRFLNLDRSDLILVVKILTTLVLAILPAAFWSGYVAFEPKWPDGAVWWALNNLIFVAVAEEALYRGCILEGLLSVRPTSRAWTAAALVASSVAFGLAHYRGGPANVGLAAFAGLFYGYAFVKTRRIQASMLIHFGLNLIHFTLFTYPALQR